MEEKEYIINKEEYQVVVARIEELQQVHPGTKEAFELKRLIKMVIAYEKKGKYLFFNLLISFLVH